MQSIIIDEEFKGLLPALDKETFKWLEENIRQNGCRDPLVLWENTLIDGHNRYSICKKHEIPFNTVDKEFDSREEALIWIINTQVSRRNLNPTALSYFRGLHYRADRKIQGTNNQYVQESEKGQNDPFQGTTAGRLAKKYNISSKTIKRDSKGADAIDAIGEASPEAKRMILDNEVKIDKKDLIGMAAMTVDEIAEIAAAIEAGTYEKKKPEAAADTEAATAGNSPGVYAPSAIVPAAPTQRDTVISRLNDDFAYYSGLRKIIERTDTAEIKAALRSFIGMLEELYGGL